MNAPRTRREFLAEVGRGMLVATVGYEMASELGLASTLTEETADKLTFGALEPLVCLMQETPVNGLLPRLVEQLRSGTDLRRLTAAAALANARTFGGEDYVGFHTMMALAPALHMAQELPAELQPLPVFKVLYRAWDLLGLIGKEQAHTLLRQSVRYCVKAESWQRTSTWDEPRTLLPKMLEEHKLLGRLPGDRKAEDNWVEQMSQTIFKSTPEQAAEAAATVLAEGMSPAEVGEAITLAANQLVLRDMGRAPKDEVPGKPVGSVHGDSIGVHACDSANAWRNLARVSNARNCFASLILGAYQVALDRTGRGGDFLNWQPLPLARHLEQIKATDADGLLRETDEAIRGNLQAKASALVQRYGESGHSPRLMFDLLLRYAVSEDGALHAEKFYRTVSEEFAATRPAFRWRHVVALARVTASEFGRPAAGMAEARSLLKV